MMKYGTLCALSLAAVALAACTDAPTPTAPRAATGPRLAMVTNEWTPFGFTTNNPCNGEIVPFTGKVHTLLHGGSTPGASTHAEMHFNFYLEGVGLTTGTKYVSNAASSSAINQNRTGTSAITQTLHFKIVSQGSAPDFVVITKFHLTLNAKGEITAFHFDTETACR
jgi:hypothetical protein